MGLLQKKCVIPNVANVFTKFNSSRDNPGTINTQKYYTGRGGRSKKMQEPNKHVADTLPIVVDPGAASWYNAKFWASDIFG